MQTNDFALPSVPVPHNYTLYTPPPPVGYIKVDA